MFPFTLQNYSRHMLIVLILASKKNVNNLFLVLIHFTNLFLKTWTLSLGYFETVSVSLICLNQPLLLVDNLVKSFFPCETCTGTRVLSMRGETSPRLEWLCFIYIPESTQYCNGVPLFSLHIWLMIYIPWVWLDFLFQFDCFCSFLIQHALVIL